MSAKPSSKVSAACPPAWPASASRASSPKETRRYPHSRSFAMCRSQVLRAHEQPVRIVPQRDVAHRVVGESRAEGGSRGSWENRTHGRCQRRHHHAQSPGRSRDRPPAASRPARRRDPRGRQRLDRRDGRPRTRAGRFGPPAGARREPRAGRAQPGCRPGDRRAPVDAGRRRLSPSGRDRDARRGLPRRPEARRRRRLRPGHRSRREHVAGDRARDLRLAAPRPAARESRRKGFPRSPFRRAPA